MLLPKHVREDILRGQTIGSEIEQKLRAGCNCCGWPGDPFLLLRPMPASRGTGWAVLLKELGTPACILYRSDRQQPADPYAVDHRVITYLHEARKNWEKARENKLIDELVKHDNKVETDQKKAEIEQTIELSKFVGHYARKEGLVQKRHKIDKKKD